MSQKTTDGLVPEDIVRLGIEAIEAAAAETPASPRGRPPAFSDAMMAILVLLAVLKRRFSKSAQYRYLQSRREQLRQQFGWTDWPSRATYFRRYLQAWKLLQQAIKHQGDQAVRKHLADPEVVAVDQSLLPAQGPRWNTQQVARGRPPALRIWKRAGATASTMAGCWGMGMKSS